VPLDSVRLACRVYPPPPNPTPLLIPLPSDTWCQVLTNDTFRERTGNTYKKRGVNPVYGISIVL
jgi:hypothetical protein